MKNKLGDYNLSQILTDANTGKCIAASTNTTIHLFFQPKFHEDKLKEQTFLRILSAFNGIFLLCCLVRQTLRHQPSLNSETHYFNKSNIFIYLFSFCHLLILILSTAGILSRHSMALFSFNQSLAGFLWPMSIQIVRDTLHQVHLGSIWLDSLLLSAPP